MNPRNLSLHLIFQALIALCGFAMSSISAEAHAETYVRKGMRELRKHDPIASTRKTDKNTSALLSSKTKPTAEQKQAEKAAAENFAAKKRAGAIPSTPPIEAGARSGETFSDEPQGQQFPD